MITKYLGTRSFKEVQKLFEQRFRDSLANQTEGSSLYLNIDRSGRRRTERTQGNINLFQVNLIDDTEISANWNYK